MPPFIQFWWALPRMREYMKSYNPACVGDFLASPSPGGFAKPPGLDDQVDKPGVQPTGPNTWPWQVRKGQLL